MLKAPGVNKLGRLLNIEGTAPSQITVANLRRFAAGRQPAAARLQEIRPGAFPTHYLRFMPVF
jgi:hypothetical protein